jgi:adenine C2-methylase RlmN of 23S rRNA A2503 and tRNA A37
MRIVQVLESQMAYAARTWDLEHASRYILAVNGRMVEFSHFKHFKAGEYVKDVIEIASSFGCTVGCHHCAAADLPHMQALTADEIVAAALLIAERHQLSKASSNLLITFSGIGEASLLRTPMFESARRLQARFPSAEFVMTTVGIRPDFISAVGDLSDELDLKFLQVSVFSAEAQAVRSMMPLGDKLGYEPEALVGAMAAERRLRYRLNYVVIDGLNSEESQITSILEMFEPLRGNSVLRVSRLNETSASKRNGLRQPSESTVRMVVAKAITAGWDAYHFYSHGDDRLNCGQLAGSYLVGLGIPEIRTTSDDTAVSAAVKP